jgi:hypothetical protein
MAAHIIPFYLALEKLTIFSRQMHSTLRKIAASRGIHANP